MIILLTDVGDWMFAFVKECQRDVVARVTMGKTNIITPKLHGARLKRHHISIPLDGVVVVKVADDIEVATKHHIVFRLLAAITSDLRQPSQPFPILASSCSIFIVAFPYLFDGCCVRIYFLASLCLVQTTVAAAIVNVKPGAFTNLIRYMRQ